MEKNLNLPLVSVLMPVYNGEKYLVEAIESILNQTYKNIEFLIVNDGSVDNTTQILNKYKKTDKRIKIISHKKNKGLVFSLNEGIEKSRGNYIARMDADDISLPNRIKEQVDCMEKNASCDICGTWAQAIDEEGNNLFSMKSPSGILIKYNFWKPSPFIHPSVIMRRKKIEKYSDNYPRAEDYELWIRLKSKGCNMYNLTRKLIKYRINKDGVSKRGRREQEVSSFRGFIDNFGNHNLNQKQFISLSCLNFKMGSLDRFQKLISYRRELKLPLWFAIIDSTYYTMRKIFFSVFPNTLSN